MQDHFPTIIEIGFVCRNCGKEQINKVPPTKIFYSHGNSAVIANTVCKNCNSDIRILIGGCGK